MTKGPLRIGGTMVVLAGAIAYILSKIDVHRTAHVIRSANPGWIALGALLIVAGTFPMAWRWQLLLRARGVREPLPWLTRSYFVSLAVGQVLPTSVGGDASRIYETIRRHPGHRPEVAGSVLVERVIGGIVTLLFAAFGFVLAIGRYPIGAYVWLEAICVVGAVVLVVLLFSRRVRPRLASTVPLARRLRVEPLARAVYEGIHGYRDHMRVLAVVALTTVLVQVAGVAAIYTAGRAVGIHLSPLPYVVLGPLLFLVTLVPFTINGLAVREAFFVSFLGRLHVGHDLAFACGFLFFFTTVLTAVPGLLVIAWEHAGRHVATTARSARSRT